MFRHTVLCITRHSDRGKSTLSVPYRSKQFGIPSAALLGLLAVPRVSDALFLVRLPIAALALHRAVPDAAAAIALLQSTSDLRVRSGAKSARIRFRARGRCQCIVARLNAIGMLFSSQRYIC